MVTAVAEGYVAIAGYDERTDHNIVTVWDTQYGTLQAQTTLQVEEVRASSWSLNGHVFVVSHERACVSV